MSFSLILTFAFCTLHFALAAAEGRAMVYSRNMLIRRMTIILILLILVIPAEALCQQKPLRLRLTYTTSQGGLKTVPVPAKRNIPRLGLALAGGGARAAASIGVLKVLTEEGIPVSAVSGTSMGAMIGGLYAAGY